MSQKLRLYTLSPLHIGTGERYVPLEYACLFRERLFYQLPQDELARVVKELIPNGTRVFANWVGDQFEAMRNTRDNREQSRINNGTNAMAFFRAQGQEKAFLNYLRNRPEKGLPILLDDDNRQRGKTDRRLNEVRQAMRTAGQAYLPGTTIKGALRTALLWDYLNRVVPLEELEQLIRTQLEKRNVRKEYFADAIEAEAFFCKMEQLNRIRPQEAQMDLLKWLGVSDAHCVGTPSLEVGKINLYLVEKERTKDRRQTPKMKASRQNQSTYAEMLSAGQELEAQLHFDATALAFALSNATAGRGGIMVKGEECFIGLRQKVQRLFDLPNELLDEATANPRDEATRDRLEAAILAQIRSVAARFAQAQLNRQAAWQEDYANQIDRENYAPRVAAGFHPVNSYDGQRLHLGFGVGFNGTTVLLHFLQDRGHAKLFERVMEKYDLGRAPRQKGRFHPNISRFPKSRRFVEGEQAIYPLGWVALLKDKELPPARTAQPAAAATPAQEPAAPAEPTFFSGKLNVRRPPELDAVVTKSGTPNIVQVYLSPDNMPEVRLDAYRSPLEVGTILRVQPQLNKKGVVLSVAYRRKK